MGKAVTPRFSRRQMLRGTALVLGTISGSAILAACGGGAAPAPTAAPAKPAEPKPAEAAKPAAPAAAATTAPAAPGRRCAADRRASRRRQAGRRYPGRHHSRPRLDSGHARPAERLVRHASSPTGRRRTPTIKIEREWFPRAEMHAKELALAATGQIGDTVRIDVAPKVAELQLKKVVHDLELALGGRQGVAGEGPEAVLAGQHQDLHP